MNQTTDTPDLAPPLPGSAGMAEVMPPESTALAPIGNMQLQAAGMCMTAQICARPRNLGAVMNTIKLMANKLGAAEYIYRWKVKNRRDGTMETIEGPTIKLALDVARIYGNSWVGVTDIKESAEAWTFIATFVDLETGFNLSRPFRQRRLQNIGMQKDAARAEDLVFQIGASKAIRNVISNAIRSFTDYAFEEADRALVEWAKDPTNLEKANKYIDNALAKHRVDKARAEAVIGKPRDKWLPADVVDAMLRLRAVDDGQTSADDTFPMPEHAKQVLDRKQEEAKQEAKGSQTAPRVPSGTSGLSAPGAPAQERVAPAPSPAGAPPPAEDQPPKRGPGRPRKQADAPATPGAHGEQPPDIPPSMRRQPSPPPAPEPESQGDGGQGDDAGDFQWE